MANKNAAICTTVAEFFATYKDAIAFADACAAYVREDCGILDDDGGNRKPWEDCYAFLRENLDLKRWGNFPILMEYMMPESQKRADVILLGQKQVLILEFKKKGQIYEKDISQAAGYQKSIQVYHRYTASHNMQVGAFLTYTMERPKGNLSLFPWLWRENFASTLEQVLGEDDPLPMDEAMAWLHSPCDCLQHLIDAAVKLFEEGELPQIKSIQDSDIQSTLDVIHQVVERKAGKNIVFVTGVPGAGKTLVGLKILYDYLKQDAQLEEQAKKKPVFLSGNDPLVNILQNVLDNQLIMPMKNYKKNAYNQVVPVNQVIIFDEAQRAWDCGDRNMPGDTEAKKILAIGDKVAKAYGAVMILCLIGNGQAIHYHEETGMPIWRDALKGREDWQVFIPEVLAGEFTGVAHQAEDCLHLDVSIRNDFINVSPWVEAVLRADLPRAKEEYRKLLRQGFRLGMLYSVQQLQSFPQLLAREYQKWHTGIVVSSHLNNRLYEKRIFGPQYQGSYVMAEEAHKWFTEDSQNFTKGASEFLIQGIEMDWPIVAFGGDYYLEHGRWTIDGAAKFDQRIHNPTEIMKNTYRVLLTRSRKGMMLYLPATEKMQETIQWFKAMRDLD